MTSLKLQGLLVLAALMLFFTSPTETKVVNSTKDCPDFFLQQTPPNIPGILDHGNILDQNRYKLICQTLNGTATFVTLYDTTNKIPVFSASMYRGHRGSRPHVSWKVEPQLENTDNMQTTGNYRYTSQAIQGDYKNVQGYDKGHLLPSSYGLSDTDTKSTFTLTNIVPQVNTFNSGSWSNMETCVSCVLDKYCTNNNNQTEGFVVIGAKPSNNNFLNKKINIPSMFWSAFCCYNRRQKTWIAGAHWGENVNYTKNTYLQTKTLAELYDELGEKFNVFPGTQCPLNTTVTEFYPRLNSSCTCPPSTTTAPPTTTQTTSTSVPTTFSTSTSGPTTLTPNVSTTSQTNTTTTLTTTTSPTTAGKNLTITSSLCDGLESGILRLICELASWLSPYFDVLGSPPKNTSVTLPPRAAARPPYKP